MAARARLGAKVALQGASATNDASAMASSSELERDMSRDSWRGGEEGCDLQGLRALQLCQ